MMKPGNKKCDVCGAMVAHTHPAHKADREIRICCECRDYAVQPFEALMKDVGGNRTRSPCLLDEFSELTDEALVELCIRALRKNRTGKNRTGLDEFMQKYATAKWAATELSNRGRADLLKKAIDKEALEPR